MASKLPQHGDSDWPSGLPVIVDPLNTASAVGGPTLRIVQLRMPLTTVASAGMPAMVMLPFVVGGPLPRLPLPAATTPPWIETLNVWIRTSSWFRCPEPGVAVVPQ